MRDAGGNPAHTVVGYGLCAGLFVFGWVVLGTMLLLNEIFGGAEITTDVTSSGGEKAA